MGVGGWYFISLRGEQVIEQPGSEFQHIPYIWGGKSGYWVGYVSRMSSWPAHSTAALSTLSMSVDGRPKDSVY